MRDLTIEPEIEVLPASDCPRRRSWSDADKLRIVEESFAGSRQVTATARRHGVSRSLLTTWRRQYRAGTLLADGSAFIPLSVAPEKVLSESAVLEPGATQRPESDERVEIHLPNGRRLLVAPGIAPSALSGLLDVVDRR